MKNRLLYILLLLGLCGQEVSAAGIDGPARREIGRTLTRIVAREVAGGYVRIEGVDASRKRVRIYTSVGLSYYPFREENLRAMRDSVRLLMPPEFRKADIELYSDKREVGELIPMACRTGAEYRKLLRKKKIVPFTNRSERPLVTRSSAPVVPSQGLAGRHIALWQSHGRYFDQPQNRWKWQRSQLWQTCEDLYTQSYVLPYLVPMLENAGACVMLPRERDVQKYEILADNDVAGQYREEEGPEKWQPGGMGFAHVQQVYTTGQNPFRDGTTRRVRSVTGGAESRAVWTADIPERGEYAVYVSYDSTPQNADDAQYTVHHLGGDSSFAVNQTMGGGTWIYLGRFLLDAGSQEVVTLTNRSRQAGRIVSADAVKIGGGYGNIARTVCDSLRRPGMVCHLETSGYPRFCEGARYWLQWAGFDEKVYSPKENRDDYKDDYMSRAHWVNALTGGSERMPDSAGLRIPVDMALAFHSDVGVRLNDDIIGTLGIFYTRENKGKFEGGADRYRSRDLTDIVMTQIVEDIRSTYEPAWSRRGLWNRAYYEARVPGVPTMLLELLSHQNFADMRYGSDPRFKFLVSRAVYKGILRYISSQYGLPYVVQPLPVESLAVQFAEGGKAAVTWSPVMDSLETTAAPTGYVVYTRIDDGGFDNGRYVDKPCLLTAQEPGRIYSYKVTAVNEGGESFPSETVAACRMPDEKGTVLIVNGFDRVSAAERARRFAGGVLYRHRRRRARPAGYFFHRRAARIRHADGQMRGGQHRVGCLRLRLRNGGDRRQHVRLSRPARTFGRRGRIFVLLGVGARRRARRGFARRLFRRRSHSGRTAFDDHRTRGDGLCLQNLLPGVAGRSAPVYGRRRCALRVGKLCGDRPLDGRRGLGRRPQVRRGGAALHLRRQSGGAARTGAGRDFASRIFARRVPLCQ